jgi:pimeloyl-ACP methyl ester carboxylesterase
MLRSSAALAAGIRGARVARIADVDHVVPLRSPEAFNETVLAFLAEVL